MAKLVGVFPWNYDEYSFRITLAIVLNCMFVVPVNKKKIMYHEV